MGYERATISRMQGYTPGEQPATPVRAKLNTNENAYPPSPRVLAALSTVTGGLLQRYPDPEARKLRELAAALDGLAVENVVATNGGDELLRLVMTTFVDAGDKVAVAAPSYQLYPILAHIQGAQVHSIALEEDWSLPRDFAARLNAAGTKVALLTNPHAPSGTLVAVARLAEIAEDFNGVLVIDEAYVNFVSPTAGYRSGELVGKYDNVLILRTLSKGYSLAGLRVAYGLGHPDLITPILAKTKDSYNLDAIAQLAACAALEDAQHARRNCSKIRTNRERVAAELMAMGIACPPSEANFLLATIPPTFGLSAAELYQRLKTVGILVRHFPTPGLADKLRISIGTPEESAALLSELQGICGGRR